MSQKRTRLSQADSELARLKASGLVLPKNPMRAQQAIQEMHQMASTPGQLRNDVRSFFNADTSSNDATLRNIAENQRIARAMRRNSGGFRRVGSSAGGDVYAAMPRFYDPMEYWDLSGLPWNMADEGHRHKLHKWLRLFYMTHYLVPILVDIFTRFPLAGMYLYSKDSKLTEFYEDIFFNRLEYGDFLVSVGREYWTIGEAFPLGSFNEQLGIWEREELLNPEDIQIENFPLLGSRQIKVVAPEYLKRLVQTKSPPKEYKQLEIAYPQLIPYLQRGEPFPISEVLVKQVAFKTTPWDDHGTPILLRGLRTLMHEEKLLASQDAIAERLYSPMILAKLGVQDLGDGQGPWIPGPAELEEFRDEMDIALASDFRLMVHHFGVEIQNVFGREDMPDLWQDFDRIERRLMQVFGINPSLLGGGANSQPYASSALQAEFMNQMLKTYQDYLKRHFRERALIIAEAQEHYDYEKKGQTRVPIFEEVLELDEDTQEYHVVKKPKLLVPDLEMAVLDLRDEATERQFLQTLRAMGVPISDERMMVGVNFHYKDSLDEMQREMIQKTVAQQEAKMETYKILVTKGLPVPPELLAEISSINGAPGGGGPSGPSGGPGGGPMGAPGPGMGPGGIVMPPAPGGGVPGGGPPVTKPEGPDGGPMPEISNERRPGLTYNTKRARTETEYDITETLPRAKKRLDIDK